MEQHGAEKDGETNASPTLLSAPADRPSLPLSLSDRTSTTLSSVTAGVRLSVSSSKCHLCGYEQQPLDIVRMGPKRDNLLFCLRCYKRSFADSALEAERMQLVISIAKIQAENEKLRKENKDMGITIAGRRKALGDRKKREVGGVIVRKIQQESGRVLKVAKVVSGMIEKITLAPANIETLRTERTKLQQDLLDCQTKEIDPLKKSLTKLDRRIRHMVKQLATRETVSVNFCERCIEEIQSPRRPYRSTANTSATLLPTKTCDLKCLLM